MRYLRPWQNPRLFKPTIATLVVGILWAGTVIALSLSRPSTVLYIQVPMALTLVAVAVYQLRGILLNRK
jgi:hypothetical protein